MKSFLMILLVSLTASQGFSMGQRLPESASIENVPADTLPSEYRVAPRQLAKNYTFVQEMYFANSRFGKDGMKNCKEVRETLPACNYGGSPFVCSECDRLQHGNGAFYIYRYNGPK